MDISHVMNACAVLTLGKDLTFRDFAQGAFRMRGIGRGQTIKLFIIPEINKAIRQTFTPKSATANKTSQIDFLSSASSS